MAKNTKQQMERLMNTEAKNSRQARIMIAKFEMLEKRLAKSNKDKQKH